MALVLIVFLVLLLLGMPVAFAIGISGFLFFVQQPALPLTMPVQLILSGTQSFSLLAIPMFIFAGNLLNNTGITSRLAICLSTYRSYAGWSSSNQCSIKYSDGRVTGSAIADASMEARILGPAMTKRGYDRAYSAVVHGLLL